MDNCDKVYDTYTATDDASKPYMFRKAHQFWHLRNMEEWVNILSTTSWVQIHIRSAATSAKD